jgi:hypothetical protein
LHPSDARTAEAGHPGGPHWRLSTWPRLPEISLSNDKPDVIQNVIQASEPPWTAMDKFPCCRRVSRHPWTPANARSGKFDIIKLVK